MRYNYPMCHPDHQATMADRLRGYAIAPPTEDDVRTAIDVREGLEERVAAVLNAVRSARDDHSTWPVRSWEVVNKRDGTEEMQVTTSYWFQGDTGPTEHVVAFPYRYMWHPDPSHEEKQEVTIRLLAKQTQERQKAEEVARAAQVAAALKVERELDAPTCVGCGKQPAAGEVLNGRGGRAPACEPCGTATAAGNATAEYRPYHAVETVGG